MTTAIILAGGLGTRLRSVVSDLPKPMAPVNKRPFLEHLLEYWTEEGVTRFILSVGYKHELISDHFGTEFMGVPVEYAVEDTPLGTGGGLVLAMDLVAGDDRVLALNGDTFFMANLSQLQKFASDNHADWCFSLFRSNDISRYMGMSVSDEGRVISLKDRINTGVPLVNGGAYLASPVAIKGKYQAGEKLSLEDDIFQHALDDHLRIFGMEFPGTFIDIGIPDDYHRAKKILTK
jgi:D-glycero-alpha-D-manno-heptose 1-phosphate guanylyltransferase